LDTGESERKPVGQGRSIVGSWQLRASSLCAGQDKTADEARLARLERAGVITRGRGPIPMELINAPRPKLKKGVSVVEALLEERRKSMR